MTDLRRLSRLCLVVVLLLGLPFISGCVLFGSGSGGSSELAEKQLAKLGEQFSRENVQRFMRGVNKNFDDGQRNQSDLRYDLADVTKQYSTIDLRFYGLRTTRSESSVSVTGSWNLRWTCTRTGTGCSSKGETVLRRGQTTFEFVPVDDGYTLISQSGDILFGSLTPGSVAN